MTRDGQSAQKLKRARVLCLEHFHPYVKFFKCFIQQKITSPPFQREKNIFLSTIFYKIDKGGKTISPATCRSRKDTFLFFTFVFNDFFMAFDRQRVAFDQNNNFHYNGNRLMINNYKCAHTEVCMCHTNCVWLFSEQFPDFFFLYSPSSLKNKNFLSNKMKKRKISFFKF